MVLRMFKTLFDTMDLWTVITSLVRKTGPTCLALVIFRAGWQIKIWVYFKIFKILYRLNYLDFHFVNIIALLLIVLEVHFSQIFLNKVYFKACFEVHKIWLPFFTSIPTIKY